MSALLLQVAQFFIIALNLLVLGRVIVSWVDPMGRNEISRMLISVTEPMLAPIRRLLPQTGMIDFSPLILLLITGFLLQLLRF
jgi:YggT family protein